MALRTFIRVLVTTAVVAGAAVLATAGPAVALPTASFTASSTSPDVGETVTFTFTGACDVAPCRIQWRWFTDGGSHLGTTMGEGEQIDYAFAAPGSYSVVSKITNATSTHGSDSATMGVTVNATVGDDDVQVSYDGWRGVSDAAASGGSYRLARLSTAPVKLRFTGTAVTYVAKAGPNRGIAQLKVDGKKQLVDLYAAAPRRRSITVGNLSASAHRISVAATGTKRPASTGRGVTVDAFVVGGARIDDTDARLVWGSWSTMHRQGAADTVRRSDQANATSRLTFTGTSVSWMTSMGPRQGRAQVVIDGTLVDTVDNYAAAFAPHKARTYGGLASGAHTIKVVVLGQHNASSLGSTIVSDGFSLH